MTRYSNNNSPYVRWVVVFFLTCTAMSHGFIFDMDTRDDCLQQTKEACLSDPDLYFQCAMTCSQHTFVEGYIGEAQDPEEVFGLQVTTAEGKKISLEDYEGYVTLFAVVPLLPGMAQYYYEMLEHVNKVFSYTVEILLFPWNVNDPKRVSLKPHDDAHKHQSKKVILLEESMQPCEAMEFLASLQPYIGTYDPTIEMDRVSIFMISSDGKYVERLISPSMSILERRLQVFLKQLDEEYVYEQEL